MKTQNENNEWIYTNPQGVVRKLLVDPNTNKPYKAMILYKKVNTKEEYLLIIGMIDL